MHKSQMGRGQLELLSPGIQRCGWDLCLSVERPPGINLILTFPVSQAPLHSNSHKHHDLYFIKPWGKARANVPALKCCVNDVASSVCEDDTSSPLSPESFFPDVVRGKQPAGVTGRVLDSGHRQSVG